MNPSPLKSPDAQPVAVLNLFAFQLMKSNPSTSLSRLASPSGARALLTEGQSEEVEQLLTEAKPLEATYFTSYFRFIARNMIDICRQKR